MNLVVQETDGVLVSEALAGKSEAFGVLVKRHLAKVYAIIHAQLGVDADVDDVAQDAFIAAYRSLDSLREPGQFASWLAVIARNAARQRIRRIVRDRETQDEYGKQAMESFFDDPQEAERYQIVAEAVDGLSADHREALLLYYFTGMPTAEMATTLGISQEAVKKRLQRAREALGVKLAGQAEELLQARMPRGAQATRIVLALAGVTPAWLAAAGAGGGIASTGLVGGGFLTNKLVLACGVLTVVAGMGGLFVAARSVEESTRPPVTIQGNNAIPTAPPADEIAAAAEDSPAEGGPAGSEPEPDVEPVAPGDPSPGNIAPSPPEYRRKRSTMAGGNAQRTGFYDVPTPLTRPTERWSSPLGVPGSYPGVMATVALDGSVLADYGREGENYLGRFSAEGELRWEVGPLGGKRPLGTATVLSDGTVVHAFNRTTGLMAAYDPETGETLWSLEGLHRRHEAPVVDRHDTIYVTSEGPTGMARIDGLTGEILWPKQDPHNFTRFHTTASPSLSLDETTLYAGVRPGIDPDWLQRNDEGETSVGRIVAVNAEDGTLKWTYFPVENFRPEETYGFDPNWSAPVVGADSTIYVQDAWTGMMIALEDQGTAARERWVYDPRWSGDVLRFEERKDSPYIYETPYNSHDAPRLMATDGGAVYMGSFGYPASVHAVDAAEGSLIWRTALDGNPVIGSPAITRDAVYVLAAGDDETPGTNALFCLDRESGEILWEYSVAGPHGDTGESVGLGADGTIYVLSSGLDGTQSVLMALR